MKQYLFNKMTELSSNLENILNEVTPSLAIFTNDTQCVFHRPADHKVNFDLCDELNIPCIPIEQTKGAVISLVGDLAVMINIPNFNKITWGTYIFNWLKEYLIGQQLRITLAGNDILLYGKKIGGYSHDINEHGAVGVLFIAMEDAQDIVNQICLKHEDKETAGLLNYGITTNEIKTELIKASEAYLQLVGLEGGN